jgi:hypothetical protein
VVKPEIKAEYSRVKGAGGFSRYKNSDLVKSSADVE